MQSWERNLLLYFVQGLGVVCFFRSNGLYGTDQDNRDSARDPIILVMTSQN